MKNTFTDASVRQAAAHISSRSHAMAGATIAAAAGLACSLGEACVRANRVQAQSEAERAQIEQTAARMFAIRQGLLDAADEDGAAITLFAALRQAGKELEGQERLCQLPVEMTQLAVQAAVLMQDVRPLIRSHQDDLEMAIRLLDGAARAATLLLDSNLRIWPDPALLAAFEPTLLELRRLLNQLDPVETIR